MNLKPLIFIIVTLGLIFLVTAYETYQNNQKITINDVVNAYNMQQQATEASRILIRNDTFKDGYVETWQVTKCIVTTEKVQGNLTGVSQSIE
jgi:hypothetical protein